MSSAAHSTQHSTTRAPVFRWALLVACVALLPLPPASAELEDACSDEAEAVLEELIATESGFSTAGCNDDFVACSAEGFVGTCSDVFACSTQPVFTGAVVDDACSEPGAVEACCVALFFKPCSTCTETTSGCLQLCAIPGDDYVYSPPLSASDDYSPDYSPPLGASDDYSPPLSASEPPASTPPPNSAFTDSECFDISEEALETLADSEDVQGFTTPCSSAGTGDFCDVLGSAGTCGSNPACDDVTVTVNDACTSSADDSGCCTVFLAKPCSTCDPEPATCSQVCVSGGFSDYSSSPPVVPAPDLVNAPSSTPTPPVTFDSPPPTEADLPGGTYDGEMRPDEADAETPDGDLTIVGGVPGPAGIPDTVTPPPPVAEPPLVLDTDPEGSTVEPEVPVLESSPPLGDVASRSAATTRAGHAVYICGTVAMAMAALCAVL